MWTNFWIRIYARVFDWPVYRVTYSTGERTYPLHRREAKSLVKVFNGKVWIDYDYAKKLIL